MKYSVDYQYMPKGRSRPLDDGEVVGITADDRGGLVILPNVGDFVQIETKDDNSFSGRVKSRLFRYIETHEEFYCAVNIVVQETDDDWGALVKE